MKDIFELDGDDEARDVYNDIAIYLDGYIYPWIKS